MEGYNDLIEFEDDCKKMSLSSLQNILTNLSNVKRDLIKKYIAPVRCNELRTISEKDRYTDMYKDEAKIIDKKISIAEVFLQEALIKKYI